MPLRFRKRLRLLPGIWLNVSKTGVSTSVGGKGLTVNVSKRGTRTTLGIPGTGLSYTSVEGDTQMSNPDAEPKRGIGLAKVLAVVLWVFLIGYLAVVLQ